MRILVTGADGFVGSWLVPRLCEDGHEVVGAVRHPGATDRPLPAQVSQVALELLDADSVRNMIRQEWDAVVHLAAVASGADASRDPLGAWEINALGTARLAHELGERAQRGQDSLLLYVSSAEVYGVGPARPRVETDPVAPCSPYAASKLAAEIAALEVHRRTGLRVVVARPFPHTGPGQDDRFVVPAFAMRLRIARDCGASAIKVGRLDAVREYLHVADVVDAYARLLSSGEPGEVYNVATGQPVSVHDVFQSLNEILSYRAIPEVDAQLVRPIDVPYLVGDSAKLRRQTGWSPQIPFEQTLREVLSAQAN